MVATARPDLASQLSERLRTQEVHVPPYPGIAAALARLGADGRPSIAEIANVVATDGALAATVLRAAASALHRTQAPPTLEAAIWRLGLEELIRLVLVTNLGSSATAPGPLAVLRRDQWQRALVSAQLCRELAERRGIPQEQAFLAGLLHDFGAIVVLACLETMAPLPTMPEASWRRLVGKLHVEFGMVVAARWQLPEPICEVISSHHTPATCMRLYRPLAQLVAMVDCVVDAVLRDGRDGQTGAEALAALTGLEPDERTRIASALPRIAAQIASLDPQRGRDGASSVAPMKRRLEHGWPVSCTVRTRQGGYTATEISNACLAFRGTAPLAPAWLTEITLTTEGEPLELLVNVVSCDPDGDGHVIVAQPFALAGELQAAWRRLVDRARRQAASGAP